MALLDFFKVPGGGDVKTQPPVPSVSGNLNQFFKAAPVAQPAQQPVVAPIKKVAPISKISATSSPDIAGSTSTVIGPAIDSSEKVFNTKQGPLTVKEQKDPSSKTTMLSWPQGTDLSNPDLEGIVRGYGDAALAQYKKLQQEGKAAPDNPEGTMDTVADPNNLQTIKFPFIDKGIYISNTNNPIEQTTKFFVELPETLVDDIHDTATALTEGKVRPDSEDQFTVQSYLQKQSDFQDSLASAGMTPTQQQWISALYGSAAGVFDFASAASLLGGGVEALAANAPVKDESVVAASNLLGNPGTLDEAETAYKNLQKISHPDVPGGSQELSAQANNAIEILRNYYSEQEGFLSKIGVAARDVMKAQYQSKILTPYVSDAEQAEWLENYGISRNPDEEDAALSRTGQNKISGLLSDGSQPEEGETSGETQDTNIESDSDNPSGDTASQPVAQTASLFHGSGDGQFAVDENGNINFGTNKEDVTRFGSSGSKPIQIPTSKLNVKDYSTKAEMFHAASEGKEELVSQGVDVVRSGNHAIGINPENISKVSGIPVSKNFNEKTVGELTQGFPDQNTPSVNNLSPLNTQAGFINPASVTKDFQDALQKIKDNIAAKQEAERLRSIFTSVRDVQVAETNQLRLQLQKILPDPKNQEALALYREFKKNPEGLIKFLDGTRKIYTDYERYIRDQILNDPSKIVGMSTDEIKAKENSAKQQAIARIQKYSDIIKKAMKPTQAMLRADSMLTDFYSKRLAEGQKLGFLDSGVESQDYINHILLKNDEEPIEGKPAKTNAGGGAMNRRFNFAKKRTFDNILDAVVFGKNPATFNALDMMTIYGQKFGTTAATNIMIPALKGMRMAKWGTSGSVPTGWVPLAPEQNSLFQNLIPVVDKETGESHVVVQRLYVPPKVGEALEPILDPDYLKKVPGYSTSKFYQAYLKGVELSLSLFHVRALSITAINNMGYTNFLKVFGEDMSSPEFLGAEREFVKAGGTTSILGKSAEAYRGLSETSTATTPKQIIKTFPIIKQVDALAKNITKMTFDVFQRKFKVVDFMMKQNAWVSSHPDATAIQANKAFRGIAKEINASYGGLHWENLGISKITQGVSRMLFLAPDWTYSNFLNLGYAFKDGPAGTAARAFWTRSAITGVLLTEFTSMMISRKLSADPTSVYLGKDNTGKDIYSNIFFVGAPGDFVNLLKNTQDYGLIEGAAQSTASKLSPFPRFAIQMLTNRDYEGRTIIPKGSGALVGTARSLANAAVNITPIPFAVSGPAQMFLNPAGNYTLPEYLISALTGARTRHVVPSGEREITSGRRKGQITRAIPKQQNSAIDQIFGAPINKPKKK